MTDALDRAVEKESAQILWETLFPCGAPWLDLTPRTREHYRTATTALAARACRPLLEALEQIASDHGPRDSSEWGMQEIATRALAAYRGTP